MKRAGETGAWHADGRGRPRLRRGLYIAGGVAALIAALIFRRNLAAEYVLLREFGIIGSGPTAVPTDASEWLALLARNRWIGLMLFNVFDLVNYALLGVMFLALRAALCAALRTANGRMMAIAVVLGLAGIVIAFASSQAFAMRSLSQRYAAAGTETERAMILAQAEKLLSVDNPGALYPGAGPTVALFLVTLAALLISVVMLRSPIFSGPTAYLGLGAEGPQMGYFVALTLAPTPALLAIPPATAAIEWRDRRGSRSWWGLHRGSAIRNPTVRDATSPCAPPSHALFRLASAAAP